MQRLRLFMVGSVVVVEALAFRWVASLAVELGFRRVCFQTDSLQLFHMWKKPPDGENYLSIVIKDCLLFSRSFDFFSLAFVHRSGNNVVDFLARNASHTPV